MKSDLSIYKIMLFNYYQSSQDKRMLYVLTNCSIHTGEQVLHGKNILVKASKIIGITQNNSTFDQNTSYEIIDLKGKNICPGFIDIQINGGRKFYFSKSPDFEALDDIYKSSCSYGTPFILPTLISSPLNTILAAIETVKKYRQIYPGVLGMHLEGPFFNPVKRGAHSQKIIRNPTNQELIQIIEKGKDIIKVITIAPQCFTQQQLNLLLKSGINVSLGHSNLTYDQTQKYFQKGIKLVTHLYNAMTQMGQRQCGTVGAIFDNPQVSSSIILDGGHCHYAAARIAYKLKRQKLFLVTDSSFLGRETKEFGWDGWNIEMKQGFYRDKNGNLAGAAISMAEAVRNAKQHLQISVQQAIKMATSRVAKAINMQTEIGFIKVGYPSKFTVFNESLDSIQTLIL